MSDLLSRSYEIKHERGIPAQIRGGRGHRGIECLFHLIVRRVEDVGKLDLQSTKNNHLSLKHMMHKHDRYTGFLITYLFNDTVNAFWLTVISASWTYLLEKNTSDLLEGRKEMFYLTTHSTHFIYGYMASNIW